MERFLGYPDYVSIPELTKEYLVFVAQVHTIEEIPLEEINGFMTGLFEFENFVQRLTNLKNDGIITPC